MNYKEIDDILPRNGNKELENLLANFNLLIETVINFGTHIIKWDTEKIRLGDENMPPLMFFRNILELGDAISILIKQSSIDSCKPLLRSLLENAFGLEYLLEKDFEKRALSYIVWHTHKDLRLYNKLDTSTQNGKLFKKEIEKDKLLSDSISSFFNDPNLIPARQNAEDILNLPKYLPVELEYQIAIKKNNNPHWYSLYGGPTSIEGLAKYLNLHASYEILYRDLSGNVHATNVFQHKIKTYTDGTVAILQIRYPEDAQSVVINTINVLMMSFVVYIQTRIPEKKPEFHEWYLAFRKPYKLLLKEQLIKIIQ